MPLGEALHGLILLVVVVIGALSAGHLFNRIGQPRVLGPIVLGIAVGTLLAACPVAVRSVLVSPTSRSLLEAVGTAGLLLLMFTVGSELRGFASSGEPSSGWRLAPAVLLPIVICALAAWPLAARLSNPLHPGPYGWLFVGICLSVTAVPVLVTIIRDLGITSLPVARTSLRIAIVTDGLAWILVTAMVIITHSTAISIPFFVIGLALLPAVTLVLPRVVVRRPALGQGRPLVVMMVVAALTGAAATQLLGFHPAIGAVLAGFCFPAALADVSSQQTLGRRCAAAGLLRQRGDVGPAAGARRPGELGWAGLAPGADGRRLRFQTGVRLRVRAAASPAAAVLRRTGRAAELSRGHRDRHRLGGLSGRVDQPVRVRRAVWVGTGHHRGDRTAVPSADSGPSRGTRGRRVSHSGWTGFPDPLR